MTFGINQFLHLAFSTARTPSPVDGVTGPTGSTEATEDAGATDDAAEGFWFTETNASKSFLVNRCTGESIGTGVWESNMYGV
jgi:hypothetical protein